MSLRTKRTLNNSTNDLKNHSMIDIGQFKIRKNQSSYSTSIESSIEDDSIFDDDDDVFHDEQNVTSKSTTSQS
jgi:hypothetical protein